MHQLIWENYFVGINLFMMAHSLNSIFNIVVNDELMCGRAITVEVHGPMATGIFSTGLPSNVRGRFLCRTRSNSPPSRTSQGNHAETMSASNLYDKTERTFTRIIRPSNNTFILVARLVTRDSKR